MRSKAVAIIYIPLRDEGTDAWRPVDAQHISTDLYQVDGEPPPDESWAFGPGAIVHCEPMTFGDGREGMAAVREASGDDPLPDPVAYARGLSDDELRDYETIHGKGSREWIIAQRELSRRAWPLWRTLLFWLIVGASALLLALRIFR